mgnify:FL=1|jgi:hypothetical protein|tara:strand:- start:35 stop:235 length:201 start_codon:yes stop_codon:yes gene_type:complete
MAKKTKKVEVGTTETIEEYLARGGKIQQIAAGVRSYDSEQPGNRWGRGRAKGAAAKNKDAADANKD